MTTEENKKIYELLLRDRKRHKITQEISDRNAKYRLKICVHKKYKDTSIEELCKYILPIPANPLFLITEEDVIKNNTQEKLNSIKNNIIKIFQYYRQDMKEELSEDLYQIWRIAFKERFNLNIVTLNPHDIDEVLVPHIIEIIEKNRKHNMKY